MKALFKNLIIVVFILISLGLVFGLGYYYGREKLNYSLWQNFVKDVQIQKAEKESLDFSLFWEVWSELEQKFINRNELNFQKMTRTPSF